MKALDLLQKMIERHRGLVAYLGEEHFRRVMPAVVRDVERLVRDGRAPDEVQASLLLAKDAARRAENARTRDERERHELMAQLYAVVPVEIAERGPCEEGSV